MGRTGNKLFVCVLFIFGSFSCAGRQARDSEHCCAGRMTKQIAAVGVNYDASIADLIALGRYDGRVEVFSGQFSRSCPNCGRRGQILWLVNFNHEMTTRDAWRHLESNGLRPAILEELLALGIMHRDLQRQFPIVALGSYSEEEMGYPVLDEIDGKRSLVIPFRFVWDEDTRFLAVRQADR